MNGLPPPVPSSATRKIVLTVALACRLRRTLLELLNRLAVPTLGAAVLASDRAMGAVRTTVWESTVFAIAPALEPTVPPLHSVESGAAGHVTAAFWSTPTLAADRLALVTTSLRLPRVSPSCGLPK